MRYLNHIIGILVFIIVLFPRLSVSQPTLQVPHFKIFAHDRNLSEEVRVILESSYQKISEFVEDSLTGTVSVYVVDTDEEFASMVGNGFPDWGIGCAIPSRSMIVLKSPLRFKYNPSFPQVVNHELAHIFMGRLSRGKGVPRWMDEGFAMYHSHQWRIGQEVIVARAVLTGSVLSLSEIESVNAFEESKAQLAYTESFLAVSYLYGEYGEGTIKEIVGHLANGTSLDLAFLRTIGLSYFTFRLNFEEYIQTKYNWASFLGDTFLFWIGLAFLAVFLYLFKRRRTRRKLKEWELEEEKITKRDELTDDQA